MASALLRQLLAVGGALAMVLCGLLVLAAAGTESGPVPFALAVVLAIAPVPLYLALLLRLDRFEPEPARTVALAFFWGATVATFVALVLNTVGEAIVGHSFGRHAAEIYGGSISAPIVEESAKGAVIYALYRWRRAEFNGVLDGIVYAGCVGLGFAMTENVLYYGRGAVESGLPGALATFVFRGLLSPFVHPLFTAATGIGLGLAVRSRNPAARAMLPWLGLGAAILLHSTWNTAAAGGLILGAYVLLFLPLLAVVLMIAGLARRREAAVIRAQLPHFVAAGVLRRGEADQIASLRERHRAQLEARRRGGRPAQRAQRDLQNAATELAFQRERAGRGQLASPAAEEERRRRWLETIAVSRASLGAT